jgi:antitoxin CptB
MNKNRLLWASRRGMLELDLILAPFVKDVYDSLEEDDKLRFEVLLECEDQTLCGLCNANTQLTQTCKGYCR